MKWTDYRAWTVLTVALCLVACGGTTSYDTEEPLPAPVEVKTYPDPPAEVAEQVAEAIRQWVAERADEQGVFNIPPRGGRDVSGTLGEFHTVHQKDPDTYSVCVDFHSGDETYDVDFFVDLKDEVLGVRDAYLHKVNDEVVSG